MDDNFGFVPDSPGQSEQSDFGFVPDAAPSIQQRADALPPGARTVADMAINPEDYTVLGAAKNFMKNTGESMWEGAKDAGSLAESGAKSVGNLVAKPFTDKPPFNDAQPTPMQDALVQKERAGTASRSDYENAYLEGYNNSPGGKAMGATQMIPEAAVIGNAVKNYVNPAISYLTGATPSDVGTAESFLPAVGAVSGLKAKTTLADKAAGYVGDNYGPEEKPQYDAGATHNAISNQFFSNLDKSNKYYDLAKDTVQGRQENVPQLKSGIDSMIQSIQAEPFHEATPILTKLQSISDGLSDDGNVPVTDLLDLRKLTNKEINPKRMTDKSSAYGQVNSMVDTALNSTKQAVPEFGWALDSADDFWRNSVKKPFLDNAVMKKNWQPEDAHNMKMVEQGYLDEMPDESVQRAQNMASNIKNVSQYNAVRRALPPGSDIANAFDNEVQNNITGGTTVGRLSNAGQFVANLAHGYVPGALRNVANVIKPAYNAAQKAVLDAIKSQDTYTPLADKANAAEADYANIKDLAGKPKMSLVDQTKALPAPQKPLALPAPNVMQVNHSGEATPMTDYSNIAHPDAAQGISAADDRQAAGHPAAPINPYANKYGQSNVGKFVSENATKPIKQQTSEIPTQEYSQDKVNSLLRNSAWDRLDAQGKAQISKQVQTMWDSRKMSVDDMVAAAKASAQHMAEAKGEAAPSTSMSDAFSNAKHAKGGRIAPSDAQIAAGNYKKDHVKWNGLDISIENPKGSMRSGEDKGGKKWTVKMPEAYGYIKGTRGADKEHVDCYFGPAEKSKRVYVIDQKHLHNGRFDEHKVFLAFPDRDSAVRAYKEAFSDGKGHARIGSIVRMSVDEFKNWLKNGDTEKPITVH